MAHLIIGIDIKLSSKLIITTFFFISVIFHCVVVSERLLTIQISNFDDFKGLLNTFSLYKKCLPIIVLVCNNISIILTISPPVVRIKQSGSCVEKFN